MRWSININQRQAVELGLRNPTEAIILGMICDCHSWAEPQIFDKSVFYWTSRQEYVRQLPLLDLKADTVYRHLKNLEKMGLIEYRKFGKKDCVRLTKLGKTYYVGKKSEFDNTPISEKNPSKFGKKSEKDSEKNPTYSSIIKHSSINDSSSSSLPSQTIENEEEGVVSTEVVPIDFYASLPEEGMDGLTKEQIVDGVKCLVQTYAGDEGSYRARLIEEILSGGGRTLRNIRCQFARQFAPHPGRRIGSNRGPVLPAGIDAFDLYEAFPDMLPRVPHDV